MVNKTSILVLIILIFSLVSVSATTGKIGNSRMILTFDSGEEIERTIRVINDNDFPVNISLFVTGDLEEDIKLIDKSFILESGEEKRAGFVIQTDKEGTFTSRINVQFTPLEGKNGVGLSAVIITKVGDYTLNQDEDDEDLEDFEGDLEILNVSKDKDFSLISVFGISSLVLLVVLILLMVYAKKRGKKEENETRIKKK
jgi:hypothetical protein